ncbi:SMP-30/gluconolactonase/LRE family protein [Draconibacterium halophilum]|uniref:SMP-30/gluconolactonase/LRE family protein n=1 Tax=Draconibacterium halophilum TaxID=2706887 RepID=A0A6C0RDC6_9BACT|nr:SMP-30/gluconolactonase/LRE family protein [Draconibacterium halophilum]QIA07141.1 SMP-30/gluconolactonase/LRE family protein [Draconibacterium halophilum]
MKHTLLFLSIVLLLFSCSEPKSKQAVLVLDTQSTLGEGALWNYKTGELMWVDIKKEILNVYNPATGYNKEMFTGQMVGTVVPTESGNALVALQNGIYHFNLETGAKKLLVDPEVDLPDNRFNDGKCDPSGRFWAGTISTKGGRGVAALYRFDPDTTIHKMVDEVSISNGIVWSADKTKMYYIDTPTQKVMAYDYDDATGEISNPVVAVTVPRELGSPDGMTIDENDKLWVALWGGSAVGCWNPSTGELIDKIEVPAKNITSCAFGDEDMGTLYITSAREGTSDEELEKWPHAGGVFKIRPGVKGVQAFYFNDVN